MVLYIILILVGITTVASILNLIEKKKSTVKDSISIKKYMPGDLPVIGLCNNKKVFNFLLDTGSNISHICKEYYKDIEADSISEFKDAAIAGLGSMNKGITTCCATFKDIAGREYKTVLSISEQLGETMKFIESNTGLTIHGLLGTDFMQENNYVIDFKELEVYPRT